MSFQIVRNKLHPKPSHRRNTWGQQGEAHLQGMLQGFHDAFQLDQTRANSSQRKALRVRNVRAQIQRSINLQQTSDHTHRYEFVSCK